MVTQRPWTKAPEWAQPHELLMVKKLRRKRPARVVTKRSLFCLRKYGDEVSDSIRSRQSAANKGGAR